MLAESRGIVVMLVKRGLVEHTVCCGGSNSAVEEHSLSEPAVGNIQALSQVTLVADG